MLRIADKTFESHLFTGTGKFAAPGVMVEAIRASGSTERTSSISAIEAASKPVTPASTRDSMTQRDGFAFTA